MSNNYVGTDYHKKYSHITAINPEGEVILSRRINNDAEFLDDEGFIKMNTS